MSWHGCLPPNFHSRTKHTSFYVSQNVSKKTCLRAWSCALWVIQWSLKLWLLEAALSTWSHSRRATIFKARQCSPHLGGSQSALTSHGPHATESNWEQPWFAGNEDLWPWSAELGIQVGSFALTSSQGSLMSSNGLRHHIVPWDDEAVIVFRAKILGDSRDWQPQKVLFDEGSIGVMSAIWRWNRSWKSPIRWDIRMQR